MLDLPNKVKLGQHNIAIDYPHEFPKEVEGGQFTGMCLYHSELIQIASKMDIDGVMTDIPYNSTRSTFMHELLHACLDFIGRMDISQDENLVNGLSETLCMLFHDNPDLAKVFSGDYPA